jgi:glycosyltransferase involved in cell wall biosynthesis
MRILHVYSGNLYGGIEAILVGIGRSAQGAAVRHEFALCFQGRLARELAAAGACVHELPAVRVSRPHSVRTARRALAGVLRSGAIDRVICHAPWAQALFGGVARAANVPLAFWAHDVVALRHWTERLARRVVPDLVIANSAFTARTVERLYPGAPIEIVYAPVAVPCAHAPDRRARLRRSLDTDAAAVVIVQASRSEPWKGHETVIGALASLRDVPNWIWWQVGGAQRAAEATFLAMLRAKATEAGIADRIRWIGERSDVADLLGAADIHCQANTAPEPFGVAFVEALAAGLPVVTSGIGGALEIVDESCGVTVPPDDVPALSRALRVLMTDERLRRRLSAGGPIRARRLCDPSTQISRLDAALARMSPEITVALN